MTRHDCAGLAAQGCMGEQMYEVCDVWSTRPRRCPPSSACEVSNIASPPKDYCTHFRSFMSFCLMSFPVDRIS